MDLGNAREQYFVMDGPIWNGCPGEALTPGEATGASPPPYLTSASR
jgi:hypothetical protein